MTEFGTLEIVTDVEVKGQEAEPHRETLNPVRSHTPTPPPEVQKQASMAAALVPLGKPGSSQAKGMMVSVNHCYCEEQKFKFYRITNSVNPLILYV